MRRARFLVLSAIKNKLTSFSSAAAIDIGTNTIRLLIASLHNGKLRRVTTERAVTRLGKGLLITGRLNNSSMLDSLNTLSQFKNICDEHGVEQIIAVGTSALREAANSAEFIKTLKSDTGIETEIISGEKEALLTLRGISGNIAQIPAHMFITDIGGGSTEWIKTNEDIRFGSISIGAVKLHEQFIKNDPPLSMELEDLSDHIFSIIKSSDLSNMEFDNKFDFVATGGTATTLAAIDLKLPEYDGVKIHLHKIGFDALNFIYKRLISLSINQRLEIAGIESQRADLIIAGTLILKNMMEFIKATEVIISDCGLLEGVLIDYWNNN